MGAYFRSIFQLNVQNRNNRNKKNNHGKKTKFPPMVPEFHAVKLQILLVSSLWDDEHYTQAFGTGSV